MTRAVALSGVFGVARERKSLVHDRDAVREFFDVEPKLGNATDEDEGMLLEELAEFVDRAQ